MFIKFAKIKKLTERKLILTDKKIVEAYLICVDIKKCSGWLLICSDKGDGFYSDKRIIERIKTLSRDYLTKEQQEDLFQKIKNIPNKISESNVWFRDEFKKGSEHELIKTIELNKDILFIDKKINKILKF